MDSYRRNFSPKSMPKPSGGPRAAVHCSQVQPGVISRAAIPSRSQLRSHDQNAAFVARGPLKRQTWSAMNATRAGEPPAYRHIRAAQVVS